MCQLSRNHQACIVVGRTCADRLLAEIPDSALISSKSRSEVSRRLGGHLVLEHLAVFKVRGLISAAPILRIQAIVSDAPTSLPKVEMADIGKR